MPSGLMSSLMEAATEEKVQGLGNEALNMLTFFDSLAREATSNGELGRLIAVNGRHTFVSALASLDERARAFDAIDQARNDF